MQALRRTTLLSRIVLIWFVMSLGVAVASPLIHPVPLDFICSASGTGTASPDSGNAPGNAGHKLDCPLCIGVMAPAAPPILVLPTANPVSRPPVAVLATPVTLASAPPLPSRGPPTLF